MPLSLAYTTPATGASSDYHVIQQIVLDYISSIMTATVSSYVSKDTFDAGKSPAYTQQIQIQAIPPATTDAKSFAESSLIELPPSGSPPQYANRYAFAGATIAA